MTLKEGKSEWWLDGRWGEVECATCNKPFIRKNGKHKFCSRECSPHKPNTPVFQGIIMSSPVERECKFCKKTFSSVHREKETCSHSCYQQIWKKANPDSMKESERRQTKKRSKCPIRKSWRASYHVLRRYGLTIDDFSKLWNDQGGLCLGCDIELVSFIFPEERKKYDDDPNLIENVDYAQAFVDHDHKFESIILPSGEEFIPSESVRGLLCPYCNHREVDPLNSESRLFIYGVDGDLNKQEIIMNRTFQKQLKEVG